MRKMNNISLAQVKKYNASRRGIDKAELANRLFHIMWNSGLYQRGNNYEVNCLRIRLFSDGIVTESLCINQYGREWYNEDEMFIQIDEIPIEYRKVKFLYNKRGLNYGEVMWLFL